MFYRVQMVLLSVVMAVIAIPAYSQIEEIVVTAQKREESIQDVPIAISALTGDQFDLYDIARADDLEKVFANVYTNRNSAGNNGISIRGVGTDSVHLSTQQSVGTYIDDVSMVSPFVGAIGLYDIERVEVLRGPQNTLYGRNTTGGAIVWHTNQANPGDGANGQAKLRLGNGDLFRFEGAYGFDINEEFAARIAILSDDFDGVWTNVIDGKDTGDAYDRQGVRANLVWNNGESTRVGLTLSTGKTGGEDRTFKSSGIFLADGTLDPDYFNHSSDSRTDSIPNYIAATAANVAAYPYLQDQFDRGTGMVIVNPQGGPFDRLINYSTDMGFTYQVPEDSHEGNWDGVRLSIDHSFANMDFSSITSYDETYFKERNGPELTGFTPHREGDWQVWQQEFRLTSTTTGPVQWLGGLYFTKSDSNEDTWVSNVGAAGGRGVNPGVDITSSYDAWSLYGQADWEVTDKLTLSAGLRYTDDKLSADNENWVRTVCGFYPSDVGASLRDRDFRAAGCPGGTRLAGNTDSPVQELSELGWKLSTDYKLTDVSLLFASTSKGFKGGAYDNRALSTGDDPIGPEYLTAYEIGYKGEFLDNTLQLNASTFLYKWEDMQLFEGFGGIPALVNVPEIESKGVEVDFKWAPNENWYFQGSVGTTDTKVTDTTGINPESQAVVGKKVTKTPDLTYNLLGTYIVPMENGELEFSVNYRYESSYFYDFTQITAHDEADSHGYLNMTASYAFGSDREHNITLWGNNLTSEYACATQIVSSLASPLNYGCYVKAFGEPMFGLTFSTRFGEN